MLAIGFVTTVSSLLFFTALVNDFDSSCPSYQNSNFVRTNLRNAGFAQRILTSREKLRNPWIARQSMDSYFAQRNSRIARLPGLRGTYILLFNMLQIP